MWEQHGFETDVRWNRPADDDFVFMATSKHFISTGGGFSALAAMLVERFDGIVLKCGGSRQHVGIQASGSYDP